MLQMFGAFAEFERNIIRERTIAGQKAALERGRAPGRRRAMTPNTEAETVRLYLTGDYTMRNLSVRFGVSSSAIKRAIYRVTNPESRRSSELFLEHHYLCHGLAASHCKHAGYGVQPHVRCVARRTRRSAHGATSARPRPPLRPPSLPCRFGASAPAPPNPTALAL